MPKSLGMEDALGKTPFGMRPCQKVGCHNYAAITLDIPYLRVQLGYKDYGNMRSSLWQVMHFPSACFDPVLCFTSSTLFP